MRYPKLKGKRYVGLVRCSTAGQADTSIDDQLVVLAAFAREHEMVHVDDVQLEGVSGSLPGNRTDIDQLIARKRSRDDFDVLLVQDTTRLTRSGPKHGAKLEYDLEAAGVKVVFVTDNLPEGDFADVYKSVLYFSGKQHAKSISMASTRGSMSSLLQGRSAHCRRPPHGIDKLYLTADGKPSHIIQNLPNGTQLKLDPETREIIGRFGRNEERGVPRHYIKQKDEQVVLVPGADDQVAVVRRIFSRHHIDNWGYYRIARELNDEDVPSPTGRAWSVAVVQTILLNPIYVGLGIANRRSSAIYNMRSQGAPKPVDTDGTTLARNRRPPSRIRPRREWYERHEQELVALLDDDVRAMASVKQQAHLDNQASGRSPKPNRDRHRASTFFLKGILKSKQGGYALTGRHTGRPSSRRRYYAVSRGFTAPTKDSVLRKMVPAEPIERAVLGILRLALTRAPDIRQSISLAIQRCQQEATADNAKLRELSEQRHAVQRKLEFIIDELDELGRDAVKSKTAKLEGQLRSLDDRIARARMLASSPPANTGAIVERVTERLTHLGKNLDGLPAPGLRRLVESFIGQAVIDLETRDVELELRVPTWALSTNEPMCLDSTFAWKCCNQAHPQSAATLLRLRLMWWAPQREFLGYDFGEAA